MLGFSRQFQQFIEIPTTMTVFEGEQVTLEKSVAVTATVPEKTNLNVNQSATTVNLSGETTGQNELLLHYAGIPIKKVDVNVLKDFKVIPGGQSIGVKLNTVGVLVVGHHQVNSSLGKNSPGEEAGINVGDIITEINGKRITNMAEVAPFVKDAGSQNESLELTVRRENKSFKTKLTPLKDKNDDKFKLGLYIRDSAAGIGTMTFYDPKSKKYGALGHVISDIDTKKPIIVEKGEIMRSTVTSIEKGSTGDPGEKLARFSAQHDIIGDIKRNSPFGIFGRLNQNIKNGVIDKALPVALASQVKEGPAQILTVVEDDEVKLFDIEIINTVPQKFPATKGLVIKITDEQLLESTGGIVQGMSGSPIIQDDKLVGAVTHVFVNDPTSGYGVHIEWMLTEAGLNIYETEEQQAS